MQQMSKVTRVLSLLLLALSLIYLYTRVDSFRDMQLAQSLAHAGGYEDSLQVNRYDHIIGLQYFLIGHSLTCVFISCFAFFTVRKHFLIDRRQYFVMLGVSSAATILYFLALAYIVASGSKAF